MGALLASLERITHIIHRGQVYEIVYTAENTPDNILKTFQKTLIKLYGATLELLSDAMNIFSENTARRMLHAILYPENSTGLLMRLKDLEVQLSYETQACEVMRNVQNHAALTDLLHGLNTPITRIDNGVNSLLEHINEREHLSILEWISPIPFTKHHNLVREARTPGTCEWLLKHEKFKEWENSSASTVLWLQGSRKRLKSVLLLHG